MLSRSARLTPLHGAVLLVLVLAPETSRADEFAAATYVRTDTDDTLVVAPRLRATLPVAESTLATAVYAVDVWTSASIDIVTAASARAVTEQRDELDLSVDHELEDVTLSLAYRFSHEPDYVSHGVSGGFSYDFADNNATIGVGLSGNADSLGRAGDPTFESAIGTFGGRLTFTQVLDVDSVAQIQYEISRTQGYLASPYRWVAIGDLGCTSPASPLCPPEHNPPDRMRHAISLFGRRAFGKHASLGAGYRFYTDDWGIGAHTIRGEASWLPSEETTLGLRYRFYTQGAAKHYRAMYFVPQPFVTSDKELSPMSSHRIGIELEQRVPFMDDRTLTLTLSAAPVFYAYTDFTPLDSITAYEISVALGTVL